MSFQAYLDNIEAKTGVSPDEFKALARSKGFADENGLVQGIKAAQVVSWLKTTYDLGHGHAMAVVALLKGKTN